MSRIEKKVAAVVVFFMGPALAVFLPEIASLTSGVVSGYLAAHIWPEPEEAKEPV